MRTHKCNQLPSAHTNDTITIGGWLHNKRDHGGKLFIEIRDETDVVQVVVENESDINQLSSLKLESCIILTGKILARPEGSENPNLTNGKIDIELETFTIESHSNQIPFQINTEEKVNEDVQLQYRFLALRTESLKQKILLRCKVISHLRKIMQEKGFTEFQTPILTASSPEGARDFLVPSRLHKGKFYALPQAPQQFKQLLMMSGFGKYFQIAPCFRDEDARADRSPGEFYQLDLEMSFATQEEVLSLTQDVIKSTFETFSDLPTIGFEHITYKDAMDKYGSDKPDLRIDIQNHNVTEFFRDSNFGIFANNIKKGAHVYAIPCKASSVPITRKICDDMIEFAKSHGAGGLAYITFEDGSYKSPIAKLLSPEQLDGIHQTTLAGGNGTVFFACEPLLKAQKIAGASRTHLANILNLYKNKNVFHFAWIVDFPMYEMDDNNTLQFSHNPFSMPKGGMEALTTQDPLDITGYQYDLVCNGLELSSGAIRNHKLDVLYKAFELVGHDKEFVDTSFKGMVNALSYGPPPHGGIAPGIERMIMLLAGTDSIRDVVAFPLNSKGYDPLMNAPSNVEDSILKPLGLKKIK